MKYIITTIFLLFTLSSFSQTNNTIKRYKDDSQRGYHIFIDGEWLLHGKWKDASGKALYDRGELVWIKLKNNKKWTRDEIRLAQLERTVKKLKQQLVSK